MPTINNPSFTSGMTGWSASITVTAVASGGGTVAHTAPNSAFFNPLILTQASISQAISGHTIGQDYILTFYANACGAQRTFIIRLGALNGTQATIIGSATSDPVNSNAPTFTPGTNSASITLNATGTTSASYVLFTIVYTANIGNISLVASYTGTGLVNNLMLDDFAIVDAPVCYRGNSIALVKNIKTGEISQIEVVSINPEIHQIYDLNNEDFVPISRITKNGNTRRYVKIKKGIVSDNVPSQDFYITSGHVVVIDGVELKARYVKNAKRIRVKPEYSYSICVQNRTAILVNNMHVIADGYEDWLAYVINKGSISQIDPT